MIDTARQNERREVAYKTMRVLRSSIHVQRIIFLSVSHRISGARAVAFSNSPLPPPLHPPPDLLSGLQLGQWGSIKWAAGHRGGHSTLLLSSGRTRSQTAAEQQAGLDRSGSGPRLGAPAQLSFGRGRQLRAGLGHQYLNNECR